jgi:AraC family transcriptional regulator
MSQIESIFGAVEFIERNLKEEIAVADIAEAVCYSMYHFFRIFNTVVHHSPYDFLMRRRLSESALALIETDRKIIEIAFDYRFNSPETFSRAFKRMFGVQPNRWRKGETRGRRFLLPRLSFDYLEHINQGNYLNPVRAEMDPFYLAGVMSLIKGNEDDIPELWEILANELEGMNHSSKPSNYYGIAMYPEDWEATGHFYLAAAEVKSPTVDHSALVMKRIPALQYARFIHKGPLEDIRLTMDYVYHTWMPKSGKRPARPLEIERYGNRFRGPGWEVSETEILIPIE